MKLTSSEEIQELFGKMENEISAIKEEMFNLVWHMRGGISLDEIFQTTASDRNILGKIIKNHIEITQKSKLPYF